MYILDKEFNLNLKPCEFTNALEKGWYENF